MVASIQVECDLVKFSYIGHDGLYFQSFTGVTRTRAEASLLHSPKRGPWAVLVHRGETMRSSFRVRRGEPPSTSNQPICGSCQGFPFRRSTREVSVASAHFALELFSSARVISLSLSGGWRESSAHPGCDGQRELAGFASFVSALAPSSPATSPGTSARPCSFASTTRGGPASPALPTCRRSRRHSRSASFSASRR